MGYLGNYGKALLCLALANFNLALIGCSHNDEPSQLHIQLPSSQISVNKLSATSTDSLWGLSSPVGANSTDLSGVGCYAVLIEDVEGGEEATQCVQNNGDALFKSHKFIGLYEAGSVVEIKDFEPNSEKKLYLIGFGANSPEACRDQTFPLASGQSLSAPQLLAEKSVVVPGGEDAYIEMKVVLSDVQSFEACDGNLLAGKKNEDYFSLSVADVSVGEGQNAEVLVNLSHPAPEDLVVEYEVTTTSGEADDVPGTSLGQSNYLTLSQGQLSAPVSLSTDDDIVYEGDEEFELRILSVSLASDSTVRMGKVKVDKAVVTIVDNESVPTISFVNAIDSVTEAAGTLVIQVNISHPSELPISGNITNVGGNATLGTDYSFVSGGTFSYTFDPVNPTANLTKSLTMNAYLGDGVDPGESVTVGLENLVNAEEGSQATTIVNITNSDV